ncbi:MAG: ribosome recycling factor [Candidatus Kerfeldbacteria bacterium]|nr:ribosome recycling factor [Candidatus Kerfeldbacteria bacterium]
MTAALFEAAIDHLRQELVSVRTGRANPSLVENVSVEAYGATVPLPQLASTSSADARTIVIQPWDKNVLKDIERALQQAALGMAPVNDGTVIRLSVPPLTEERRREYLKILNSKLEAARVAVRKIREDQQHALRQAKQAGQLSEDQLFAQQKTLQKHVDSYMQQIQALGQQKEQELLTV